MDRRQFILGTAGFLKYFDGRVVHAQPSGHAAIDRLAEMIWRELSVKEMDAFRELSVALAWRSGQPAPVDLPKRIAADFRRNATSLIRRVRLSHTEISWYLLQAGYL